MPPTRENGWGTYMAQYGHERRQAGVGLYVAGIGLGALLALGIAVVPLLGLLALLVAVVAVGDACARVLAGLALDYRFERRLPVVLPRVLAPIAGDLPPAVQAQVRAALDAASQEAERGVPS